MFDLANAWALLAQIAPEAGGDAGGGAAPPGGGFNSFSCLLPAMLGLVLMYILLLSKPQQKEQARQKEMLGKLKKNDRVVTAGGVVGVVVSVNPDSDMVSVRIDESNNTKLTLMKSSIARVLADESADKSAGG